MIENEDTLLIPEKNENVIEYDENVFYDCEGCFYLDIDTPCKCPMNDQRYIWKEV